MEEKRLRKERNMQSNFRTEKFLLKKRKNFVKKILAFKIATQVKRFLSVALK